MGLDSKTSNVNCSANHIPGLVCYIMALDSNTVRRQMRIVEFII